MYQLDLFEDSYLPSHITLSYKPSEPQQQMLRSRYMPKHFSFPLYEAAAEMPSALMAYCWLENITAKDPKTGFGSSSKGRISRLS